jgi:hypothetical protein
MSPALENMVNAMIACIGAAEHNGDNVNFITNWYGENGQPWCDMTVTYAAYHSNNQAAVCFNRKRDYTVDHAQAFKDHGQWHTDTAGIRRGDIVFFDWNGSNSISAIDHVGIVESVSGSDVHTIEGNIDNVCKRMVRHADTIVGYGRPAYAADATPTPPVQPNPDPTPAPKPPVPTPVPPPPYCSLFNLHYAQRRSGAHKPDVLAFQKALARTVGLDYSSGPGLYGPATTAACAKFQRLQGWAASGTPNFDVLNLLARKTGLLIPAP